MKTITLESARAIAADWHSGQWSALYAFASSGTMDAAQEPLCLAEIAENLSNVNIKPFQAKRLAMLKLYLENRYLSSSADVIVETGTLDS